MKTTVINIRDRKPDDPPYIYIGRRHSGNPLSNPFDTFSGGSRDWACDKFEDWAPKQPKVILAMAKIKPGSVLGCFCKPKRCHGDWIAKWVDAHNND